MMFGVSSLVAEATLAASWKAGVHGLSTVCATLQYRARQQFHMRDAGSAKGRQAQEKLRAWYSTQFLPVCVL